MEYGENWENREGERENVNFARAKLSLLRKERTETRGWEVG